MAELTVPQVDFSTLGQLPQIYKQAQAEQGLKAALANGFTNDPQSLAALAGNVAQYNPQMGLSLATLGMTAQQRQAEAARQAERDKVSDAHQKFMEGIALRSANRADEDAFSVQQVTNPDGSTSFVKFNKRTGDVIPTGPAPAPINPATNPKNPFNSAMIKHDAERVSGYSDASKLAEEGTGTLDQIDALRKAAFTAPVIGPLAAKMGHPATQALEASTNALALDVAQKMKGSLSDKDIAFVKSQVPSAATGGAAGEAASGMIRSGFERTKQRAQFYRTWAEQNGNINGADAAWSRYISENPITVEDKKALGGRRYNPDYNKDFSAYLSGAQSKTGALAPPKPGQLVDGYRFKGGDPSDPASWVKAP